MAGRIHFRHDYYDGVDGFGHGALGVVASVSGFRLQLFKLCVLVGSVSTPVPHSLGSAIVCKTIGSREGRLWNGKGIGRP